MKLNKEDQPIIINNNIQNVNTNDNSHVKNSSQKGKNWSLIVIIGLIASLLTIYMFFESEINALFGADYNPRVEQGE